MSETPEPAPEAGAAPAPALSPEAKAAQKASRDFGTLFQLLFLQPFLRRTRYLYTGISDDPGLFVLGTAAEHDDKNPLGDYCNPDEAFGLVYVPDAAIHEQLTTFFTQLQLDLAQRGVLNVTTLAAELTKVKWDVTQLSVTRQADQHVVLKTPAGVVPLWIPTTFYFAMEELRELVQEYCGVFIDRTRASYAVAYTAPEVGMLLRVDLTPEVVAAAGFAAIHPKPLRMVVVRGLNLLHTKFLAKAGEKTPGLAASFVGFRFWTPSGRHLCYGHVYECPSATIAVVRRHAFQLS